jgi:phosphoesterase RecJ-like protein
MTGSLQQLIPIIKNNRTFVLTTHVNPDGDGLGSELALAYFLQKLGKSVRIINHSPTPENYLWLDRKNMIVQFIPERDRDVFLQADVVVILDTNQPDRLRSIQPFVTSSNAVKIVIDHHLEPHPFGNHYVIDDDATSTGEIVYKVISAIDPKYIDKDIAEALYAAIMTDTGSFRFPRTDAETHTIASHLLSTGIDPTEIYVNIYENWTSSRMRLLGEVLDSMKTAHNGQLAYVVCTQKMFQETGTTEVETDNFTAYPMSIRGVRVGILFNELKDGVKISFRSKGTIPINQLAKEFGGNGHLNAAGARLFHVSLDELVPSVIQKAEAYLSESDQPTKEH